MSTAKHGKDDNDNSIKAIDGDTRKIINQTFDDAKNNARKAIDETHRELPRYMQTVTNNQEQTVNAARDIIDNYIESQRDITNSFQSAWTSFFDNYFWISPKRITETYARTVSSISDSTIAAIRIWNGTTLATTETMRISIQYMRDNARETSRVAVNGAKMLEEATHFPNVTISSTSIENKS
ncbi:MAG: hypothetical protein WAM14_22345 [Candidatus Nitrosopolaris sp.]